MTPSFSRFRLLFALAPLVMSWTLPEATTAAKDYQVTEDVVLTDLQVSLAKTGQQTLITFRLENRGTEPVTFRGLIVVNPARARIVGSLGGGATTTLASIPVSPDQVLSLDGKTLWIEVDELASDLVSGPTIAANVLLGTSAIPISLPLNLGTEPSS